MSDLVANPAPLDIKNSSSSGNRDRRGSYPSNSTNANREGSRFPNNSQQETPVKMMNIAGVAFGMMSGPEIMRASVLQVSNREMYKMQTREPALDGVLDPRLGVSDKSSRCETCHEDLTNCTGHWGFIALDLPVYHIGFLRSTINVLQNICKTCSRVLVTTEDRKTLLRQLRDPRMDSLRRQRFLKRVLEMTKKCTCCPHCGAINGVVKKVNGTTCFRIIHERYRYEQSRTQSVEASRQFQALLAPLVEDDKTMAGPVSRAVEDINPLRARELLSAIPDGDLDLLWHDRERGRPENMILDHLPVPPVAIRPSVAMEGGVGSNEDDITVKLSEVVLMNSALRVARLKGGQAKMVQENWDCLQILVASVINGELPGVPPGLKPRRPVRALAQRLKGKQGRFRGNLSGKRVDFSGRTVISPDPNLPVFCVGVPLDVAKTLTYPERVTALNIEKLRKCVLRGPSQHPGANTIRYANGALKSLHFGDRERAAASLRVGDTVERHLQRDDIVLFNRQPSLHKMSIMSHRARILQGRTFRFNECVCTPYNADFDGDEMNLHLPQTEEARAEAATLMDVRSNLITSRSGEPLIAANQDFLTAAWLLTQRDTLLTREEFCQLVAAMGDADEEIEIPLPAILKPLELWTGKQAFSLLIRPNRAVSVSASLSTRAKNYSGRGQEMCANDGWVVFRNSQLLCGNLDKETIGGGSKNGLVFVLIRDNGGPVAARALQRITKMTSRWISNFGFSIGLEDVTPSPHLQEQHRAILREGYAHAERLIAEYKRGELPLQPGCNAEQSLEVVMNGTLSKLRETMGSKCMDVLGRLNSPRVMATCGSKGSVLNISQMVACVGQQSVGGARIQEGFVDRTLPIFEGRAKDPAAKGFVSNSFWSGLEASEFFFHTMGGREGLVDTVVKTADTGYMQRRMMKTLEDLAVSYDGSVRSSTGDLVQVCYGDDGLDPAYMENNGTPADVDRALVLAKCSNANENQQALRNIMKLSLLSLPEHMGSDLPRWQSLLEQLSSQGSAEFGRMVSTIKELVALYLSPSADAPKVDALLSGLVDGVTNDSLSTLISEPQNASLLRLLTSDSFCGARISDANRLALATLLGRVCAALEQQEALLPLVPLVPAQIRSIVADHLRSDSFHSITGQDMELELLQRAHQASHSRRLSRLTEQSSPNSASALARSNEKVPDYEDLPGADFFKRVSDYFCSSSGSLAARIDKVLQDVGLQQLLQQSPELSFPLPSRSALSTLAAASAFSKGRHKDQEAGLLVSRTVGLSERTLRRALDIIGEKYRKSRIQAGEAVGAVAAHSLGEPATQMTLKTFHFAGVASMNVTLGVPRIKEIMNAAKVISTPIIEAFLENEESEASARVVKASIEKSTLGDIAESISECYSPEGIWLEIVLDLEAISRLSLGNLNVNTICKSILDTSKLYLTKDNICITSHSEIKVFPPKKASAARVRAARNRLKEQQKERNRLEMEGYSGGGSGGAGSSPGYLNGSASGSGSGIGDMKKKLYGEDEDEGLDEDEEQYEKEEEDDDEIALQEYTSAATQMLSGGSARSDAYFALQTLKTQLAEVIVAGIPSVNRAVITKGEKGEDQNKHRLLVEGYDLLRVMGTPGVKGSRTSSNHIIEVCSTLGIEAARLMIQKELAKTYGSYGIVVDSRHTRLLADVMTYKGEVLGVTRFGIAKMKDSVLMLASFEKTSDHLFDAAVHSRLDDVVGVSESIVIGTPIPLGTGMIGVVTKEPTKGTSQWTQSKRLEGPSVAERKEMELQDIVSSMPSSYRYAVSHAKGKRVRFGHPSIY